MDSQSGDIRKIVSADVEIGSYGEKFSGVVAYHPEQIEREELSRRLQYFDDEFGYSHTAGLWVGKRRPTIVVQFSREDVTRLLELEMGCLQP